MVLLKDRAAPAELPREPSTKWSVLLEAIPQPV
jgi:hypothetical protein